MGTTCSCVGPCESPSCLSDLKYKLQYSAETRRLNRQCPCTNRRPRCLRRRRRRPNPFCDCEEIQQTPGYDYSSPPTPTVRTPPLQQKPMLRCQSRSDSPAPRINVQPFNPYYNIINRKLFPCTAQKSLRTAPGCQARPPTPATKDACTCIDMLDTPPSEPQSPRLNRCPRSKPPTPVCPRKAFACTAVPVSPSRELSPPRLKPGSKVKSTVVTYPKKGSTKSVCIQAQRPEKPSVKSHADYPVSRPSSPTCNKATCPFLNGRLSRPPSPENDKKICICTNSLQAESSNPELTDKNPKNICRFTVDAYFT